MAKKNEDLKLSFVTGSCEVVPTPSGAPAMLGRRKKYMHVGLKALEYRH